MKFLQIHTFYQGYLESFYRKEPELARRGYNEQIGALIRDAFSGSHMFAPYLGAHGYDSMLVIANSEPLQRSWLAEHAPQSAKDPRITVHDAVLRQVEWFKPDVLYLTDPIAFDSRFLRCLSWKPKLVMGWRAAEVQEDTDWSGFDLMLSGLGALREFALKLGAKHAEGFFPGYPVWVNDLVGEVPLRHDVVFSGQWSSGQHGKRSDYLRAMAAASMKGAFSPRYHLLSTHEKLPLDIAACDEGAVFGLDMHRALMSGRIVFDSRATHLAKDPASGKIIDLCRKETSNMRIIEATGCGRLLLTERHDNLSDYFEVGREIESFGSSAELLEKIEHYLAHPDEREAIARRGQERCLREYSMEKRAAELDRIVRRHLALKAAPKMAAAPAAAGLAAPAVGEGVKSAGCTTGTAPGQTESAASLKEKAAALLKEGGEKEAFQLLIKAKALKTPLQGLDLLRAHCFLRMGEPLAALEALREELRHFPGNNEAAGMAEELQRQLPPPGSHAPAGLEPEFIELLKVIRPYTMLSEQRLHSLYTLARSVCERDLPGNFVECGVAAGGSSALLAFVIKRYSRQPRRLFSFDSFSGMPKPTELDSHQGIDAEATGWGTGTCAAPEESVRQICTKLGVLEIVTTVKGYFEETLPMLRDWVGMVAMLHLDGDWYSSTKAILDNLYDRLMHGAMLQVDDYGYWDGCRKAIHEFEASRGVKFGIKPIDGTGVWFSKPDAFPLNERIDKKLIEEFRQDDPAPRGITSQMSINERFQLYHAVRAQIPGGKGVVRFVEIGSYSGASLLLTHQAMVRRGQAFQGISVEPGGTEQFHQVVKLLKSDVIHLPMFSNQAAKRLAAMFEPDQLPQFIFVDGDHTYPGVRQDILDFYPLLRPGGVMVFHDYLPELDDRNRAFILHHHGNAEPGIRRACQELMEETYHCERIDLPLLYPSDPTQTQPQLPIIPGVFSTVRAYRKPI